MTADRRVGDERDAEGGGPAAGLLGEGAAAGDPGEDDGRDGEEQECAGQRQGALGGAGAPGEHAEDGGREGDDEGPEEQHQPRVLDGLGDAHVVHLGGAEDVVGAVGEAEREDEEAEADDDRGQDQRLRQRVRGAGDGLGTLGDERGLAVGQAAGGEDQHVGGVGDHRQPEEVRQRLAAHHQVGAGGDEDPGQEGEQDLHQSPRSASLATHSSSAKRMAVTLPRTTR